MIGDGDCDLVAMVKQFNHPDVLLKKRNLAAAAETHHFSSSHAGELWVSGQRSCIVHMCKHLGHELAQEIGRKILKITASGPHRSEEETPIEWLSGMGK